MTRPEFSDRGRAGGAEIHERGTVVNGRRRLGRVVRDR
jgi:hypothetical protein